MYLRSFSFRTFCVLTLAATITTAACDDDEDCLVEGENCSSKYIEENYGDDRSCCGGLSCKEGAVSKVLVCK